MTQEATAGRGKGDKKGTPMQRTVLRLLLVAAAASAVGFVIHVTDQNIVPPWVQRQMRGVPSAGPPAGWTFAAAALSSIEIGAGYAILYALLRLATPTLRPIARGLLTGTLALALGGQLIRQPLMNWIIGNPIYVTLAMAVGPWLTSLAMGVVLALSYEAIAARKR